MASEVDICNLALANIGEDATVSSLYPAEGSRHAAHCARFYPIARDSLLEMHNWGFATKRVTLAALSTNESEWDYCYAQPADTINIIAILPPDATDDYSAAVNAPSSAGGLYVPKEYSCEINSSGAEVIYTDQESAVLRYSASVSDPSKFSPLFVTTLSWHLASMLAGPVIKGDVGRTEAQRCAAIAESYLSKAATSDAGQRRSVPQHNVPWFAGR